MYVPMSKRSKKERKKFYSSQRKVWDIPPVTKVIPNKKKSALDDISKDCYN